MDDLIIIFLFGIMVGLVLGGAIGIVQVSLKNNHKKSDNDNIMQDE